MKQKRANLVTLQAYLRAHNIDAFLIPRADVHQGEYVPARDERLAWVSGFTGSAGMACVTDNKAAIFVDGRYTLQADFESPDFERLDLSHEVIAKWVGKETLSYDPWLFTPSQIDALSKYGVQLQPLSLNPIDAIWTDQPDAPKDPAQLHDSLFAGKSTAEKIEEVSNTLKRDGIDATIISLPDSLNWLLNIRGNDVPYTPFAMGFAVLWAKDKCLDLFMDGVKLSPQVLSSLTGVRHQFEKMHFEDYLIDLSSQASKILVDPQTVPVKVKMILGQGQTQLVEKPDPILLLKACKNTVEVQGAHAAHLRDGVALTKFIHWLDCTAAYSSVTEIEAAEKLDSYRREGKHFKDLSFATISGTADHGAIMHYRVSHETNKVLEKDNLFLVDSGGQYLDGTTDVTRTVIIGTPSSEHIKLYTTVLKGHISLATARFPKGTNGHQLDALARIPLWQQGIDYAHGTGHGVGSYLSVHEGPQRIAKFGSNVPLAPGMILSNEPGYYRAGAFGIRIENLVVVIDDTRPGDEQPMYAFENLTVAPYDRRLIDPHMLSPDEIQWINFYHKHVFDKLCTHLDDETTDWLRLATLPLSV